MRVLNIGACHIDWVYRLDHIVRAGETISSKSVTNSAGGKGLNQSIALARAGAEVFHAGCIGEDGLFLKALMEEAGVDASYLKVVPEKTGHAIIQVDKSGENSIILFDGTDEMIDDEYVSDVLSHFEEGDYLILQNEINNIPSIVNMAYDKGMKIIFNPSPYNEKMQEVDLSKLAWMIVNEVEARDITGNDNVMEAFTILKEKYPNLGVVITLGKRGCMYTDGNEIKSQDAYKVQAVDTTGAGDTFTGYFFAGVAYGKTNADSAKQASLAAAISTTKHGAATSIPQMSEVEKRW